MDYLIWFTVMALVGLCNFITLYSLRTLIQRWLDKHRDSIWIILLLLFALIEKLTPTS